MAIGIAFPDPVVRSLICSRATFTAAIFYNPNRRVNRSPTCTIAQIAAQKCIQHMILPAAVDAQILAGIAFLAKADLGQEAAAGGVVGQAGGLDTVQAEAVEDEQHERLQRLGHIALARIGLADPIAEIRGLGDAAADIAEIDAAQQGMVVAAEDEEAVAAVFMPFERGLAQAAAKGRPRQRVDGPGRLPRRQKCPALLPQFGPGAPVAPARRLHVEASALEPIAAGNMEAGEAETDHAGRAGMVARRPDARPSYRVPSPLVGEGQGEGTRAAAR